MFSPTKKTKITKKTPEPPAESDYELPPHSPPSSPLRRDPELPKEDAKGKGKGKGKGKSSRMQGIAY